MNEEQKNVVCSWQTFIDIFLEYCISNLVLLPETKRDSWLILWVLDFDYVENIGPILYQGSQHYRLWPVNTWTDKYAMASHKGFTSK